MRTLALLILSTILGSTTGSAQVRVSARIGGTWSSKLVQDQIIEPITVKAAVAPTLTLGASLPSGKHYRLGIEAALSSSGMQAKENGVATDLGSLRTATLLLTAEGPAMARGLYWRIGLGLIKYLPSVKQGLFLQGGPTKPTGTFTLEYRHALRPGWELTADAKYGFHQFMTKEMTLRGFSRGQDVHRIGLEIGAARYFQ